ncbi:hypothetical protein N9M06_02425 [Candidatus Poseidoniales archaeon]|nr:hypothetical protein [Candidatus Poseidoniales archaeon]MDC3316728.1 hypothetical protein [Candidatus Poseidoniaceae archaeon]MDA8718050.1 hypothetical protein [Candidatus Poseidoniales archaeon]MDA8777558.1 hypothetical protein [Candidatus Poseidoniales archaeon]MDB2367021.1 hypothetical protein [Candidatus Poseidoniales archaeon]|tara:strand:+ start:2346 stop:3086 length:741 start_codon:yes stop_codon:yes gene_type:complete
MFGMSDPNQTLSQMIRYFEEQRYEMVEVMSSEFTGMLLSQKSRDAAAQTLLVKGLRILTEVLSKRKKHKLAIKAASVLQRERKKLEKTLLQSAPQLLQKITPLEEDLRRIGDVYAACGKTRKAVKFFLRAHKIQQGNILALLSVCQSEGNATKYCKALANDTRLAGPVILENGQYWLKPEGNLATQIDSVLAVLESCSHGHSECGEQSQRIRQECSDISEGITAANVRLQSAMDTLKPKHDYYEYS